ncbi:MAG: single-stranded DNA-binding protein [Bacteroidota bacterium]
MSNLNKVMLIGRLGQNPDIRHLEIGAAVGKFSIATTESYKDKQGNWQDQTEWHDIVVWRALAERAEKQLKKGSLVYIEGKLTHRKWEDQNGNNRKTTEVVAALFRSLERREANNLGGNFPSSNDEPAALTTSTVSKDQTETNSSSDESSDDLPF